MIKISVVVPIYGVERFLRQCLDSLSVQTLEDIEFILVDDGSKDSCPKIIDEYAERDGRFKALHIPNGGYGKAVNFGFSHAAGEYVGIVEPDDWIERTMFATLYNKAAETKADVVKTEFCTFVDGTDQPGWKDDFSEVKSMARSFLLRECPLLLRMHPSIWTCIYRRAFLDAAGIRMEESSGATWQDNLFQVQTLVCAARIAFVPGVAYHYRLFPLKKLKDPLMPARRSAQIRAWLRTVSFCEEGVMTALSERELLYIKVMVRSCGLTGLWCVARAASEMLSQMPCSLFCGIDSSMTGNDMRQFAVALKRHPYWTVLNYKIDFWGRMKRYWRWLAKGCSYDSK